MPRALGAVQHRLQPVQLEDAVLRFPGRPHRLPTRMTVNWACAIRSRSSSSRGSVLVFVVVGRPEQDPIWGREHHVDASVLHVEVVEVREQISAIGIDAGDPDHRAGEAAGCLVGHEGRVDHRPDRLEVAVRPAARRTAGSRRRSGPAASPASASMATRSSSSSCFDPALDQHDADRVRVRGSRCGRPAGTRKFVVVVEDDQSGRMREVPRLDADLGGDDGGEVLQLRGDQRRVESGGEGVTAAQAQRARPAPQRRPVRRRTAGAGSRTAGR